MTSPSRDDIMLPSSPSPSLSPASAPPRPRRPPGSATSHNNNAVGELSYREAAAALALAANVPSPSGDLPPEW